MGRKTELLDLIELVYAGALDEEQWQLFLDTSASVFGGTGASFELIDKKSGQPLMLELSSDLSTSVSRKYLEYYSNISPRVKYGLCQPENIISYDYAILTEAEMDADEYYSDFTKMVGTRYFLAANIVNSDHYFSAFAVHRTRKQGHADQQDISLMQYLMPHIQQATDLRFRLRNADILNQSLLESLEYMAEATLFIEASGKVFYANQAAENVFASDDGIQTRDKSVHFADKTAARLFDAALNNQTGSGGQILNIVTRDFIARRPSGKRPYNVALRPLPTYNQFSAPTAKKVAAIIFIRDPLVTPCLDQENLKQSYSLTPAELDIALAFDSGQSMQEIADHRDVSIMTVRSQLYGLMSKVSVNRQSDLMRLLGQYRRPFG